jgi:hypothetical protein
MFKLAGAVVDFYDDPDFHSSEQAQALIKEGHLKSLEEVPDLQDKDFAVKILTKAGAHRKFPIFNKVAATLSGRYFEEIEDGLPVEIRKVAGFFLKQAHEVFGIDPTPSLLEEFEAPSHNEVEYRPEEDDGRIRSTEVVVKLAQYSFMEHHRNMTPLEKTAKAIEIDKAVRSCGEVVTEQEVWDHVPKDEYGSGVEEMLRQRAALAKEAGTQIAAAFDEILAQFKDMPPKEGPFLIHQFDKSAGFDYRYGIGGIEDPFHGAWAGFPLPKKEAGAKEDLLRHKLETIAHHDRMLKRTFSEKFVGKFISDPKGCYEEASPEQKKVLDYIAGHIPPKKSEADEDKGMPVRRAGPHAEVDKAKKDLKKTQVKPSERPTERGGGWRESIYGAINAGL